MTIETKIIENFKLINNKIINLERNMEEMIAKKSADYINSDSFVLERESDAEAEIFRLKLQNNIKNALDVVTELKNVMGPSIDALKEADEILTKQLKNLDERFNEIVDIFKTQAEHFAHVENKINKVIEEQKEIKSEQEKEEVVKSKDGGISFKKDGKSINITINV